MVPTAGRSDGNALVGKNPGFAFSTSATVRRPEVGYDGGGACVKKVLAKLLGKFCCTNFTNCCVSTVVTSVLALEDVRPNAPMKKNILLWRMGPPSVPPNSFLRNAGIARQPTESGGQY